MATAQQQDIIALTTTMFDAPPGATFLTQMEEQLDSGQSLQEVAAGLATTPFFNSQFSGLDSVKEKIDLVLSFVGLDEQSSAYDEAFDFFETSIADGVDPGVALAEASSFLSTTENEDFAQAAATFRNKVDVGVNHTIDLGFSSDSLDELKSVVEGVTDDQQTVTQSKQQLEEQIPDDGDTDTVGETDGETGDDTGGDETNGKTGDDTGSNETDSETGGGETPITLEVGVSDEVYEGTDANDVFALDVEATRGVTDDTQKGITGFDLDFDSLRFDLAPGDEGGYDLTTLDEVEGVTSVEENPFGFDEQGSTLINFGPDGDGDPISLELAGVANTDWSQVDVAVV